MHIFILRVVECCYFDLTVNSDKNNKRLTELAHLLTFILCSSPCNRLINLARLIVIVQFFIWRMRHRDSDSMVLWWITVVGDFWFGVSWLLNQASKLNPIRRVPNLELLNQQFDPPRSGGGGSSSQLPCVDVFINTVDPVDEPVLCTMTSVLSILATDYPVGRHATYFSDDGGSLVHYEALLETARFAALWAPFCRKHRVEPRAPESYFAATADGPYAGDAPGQFLDDRRHVRREYEEFKERLAALFTIIPQRSEAHERESTERGGARATYMADGSHWPGTWIEPAENHKKGQHAAIVQVHKKVLYILFCSRLDLELDRFIQQNQMC